MFVAFIINCVSGYIFSFLEFGSQNDDFWSCAIKEAIGNPRRGWEALAGRLNGLLSTLKRESAIQMQQMSNHWSENSSVQSYTELKT